MTDPIEKMAKAHWDAEPSNAVCWDDMCANWPDFKELRKSAMRAAVLALAEAKPTAKMLEDAYQADRSALVIDVGVRRSCQAYIRAAAEQKKEQGDLTPPAQPEAQTQSPPPAG